LAESQGTSISKSLTEIQSNRLDCKADCSVLGSNRQQAIVNKSSDARNGLINDKVTFVERCNINGQEPEIRNGDSTMRPDESLRKLKIDKPQKNGFDNRL